MIEIHHFTHNETTALSLEGKNLYFTSKIKLHLAENGIDFETMVSQEKSISRGYIVIQKKSLPLFPSKFAGSSDNGARNIYQECEEMANVHLFTHFGDFTFGDVKVRHKVYIIATNTILCS